MLTVIHEFAVALLGFVTLFAVFGFLHLVMAPETASDIVAFGLVGMAATGAP